MITILISTIFLIQAVFSYLFLIFTKGEFNSFLSYILALCLPYTLYCYVKHNDKIILKQLNDGTDID